MTTKKKTTRKTSAKKPARSSAAKTGTKRQAPKPPKPGAKMSGLEAAARVLKEAGEPLNCSDMVQRMIDKKYWSTTGKTPANTLYSAILREINTKGKDSRFKKVSRGQFALTR